jgi:hypothetical protein
MSTVTQHRTKFFLTGDLAVEFSVFDHHHSEVSAEAWEVFTTSYRQGHGSAFPASTLTDYVLNHVTWTWDETYTDGTVAIGEPDGPLGLQAEPVGPEGCRILFWDNGTCYDTGLRVWAEEAAIIARLLRTEPEPEAGE